MAVAVVRAALTLGDLTGTPAALGDLAGTPARGPEVFALDHPIGKSVVRRT